MRPSSKVESSLRSPETRSRHTTSPTLLHPVLQSALANLDIQLEEELARYRRQRAGERAAAGRTSRHSQRQRSPKPLDLIAVSATGGRTRPTETSEPAPPGSPDRISHLTEHGSILTTGDHPPATAIEADPGFTASSSTHFAIAVQGTHPLALRTTSESEPAPSLSGTILASSLVQSRSDSGLDDYLESSEELLRSLAEEEAEIQAEQGFMQSLLTPLGLGSMLLLLVSSAMFGYVLMNPSIFSQLSALRTLGTASNPQQSSHSAAGTASVPQPNLAGGELNNLNLDTLGTLTTRPSLLSPSGLTKTPTSIAPVTNPAIASTKLGALGNLSIATVPPSSSAPLSTAESSTSTAASTGALAPSQLPVSNQPSNKTAAVRPSRSVPARTPVPSATQQRDSVLPSNSSSAVTRPSSADPYPNKVVVPYESDRSLENARQSVPDAYVRNFSDGARVQVGAYGRAADAEAKAAELRKQGIPAEVLRQ